MDSKEADLKLIEAAKLVSNPSATREDADRAVAIFTEVSDAGISGGMFGLAELKMSGRWVPQDTEGAISLYTKAAEQGNIPAMFRLGNIFVTDKDHEDPAKAFDYLTKCADAGFPLAHGCLGDMHYYGIGRDKDPARAAEEYMRAASKGDFISMFKLGCMFEAGIGVEKDPKRSQTMFYGSAQGGVAEAQFKVASMVYDGEMPGGHEEAAKWYTACSEHVPVAKFNLATMYLQGDGVAKDAKKAFSLYRDLADLGDKDAAMQVGKMYLDGEGVEQNAEEGFRYIGIAAKAGDERAILLIDSLRRRQNTQIIHIDGAEEK